MSLLFNATRLSDSFESEQTPLSDTCVLPMVNFSIFASCGTPKEVSIFKVSNKIGPK